MANGLLSLAVMHHEDEIIYRWIERVAPTADQALGTILGLTTAGIEDNITDYGTL